MGGCLDWARLPIVPVRAPAADDSPPHRAGFRCYTETTHTQLGRSTRLFASDESTATSTTTNVTGRPPLPGKENEKEAESEAPLFKTPQKPKKASVVESACEDRGGSQFG
jgi:hypothetical protein